MSDPIFQLELTRWDHLFTTILVTRLRPRKSSKPQCEPEWASGHCKCLARMPRSTSTSRRAKFHRDKVEFRGDGMWQWGLGSIISCGNTKVCHSNLEYRQMMTWLRAHGTKVNWAELLFDGMPGWHSSVLLTSSPLTILPKHPDYGFVSTLFDLAQLPESESIPLLKDYMQKYNQSAPD